MADGGGGSGGGGGGGYVEWNTSGLNTIVHRMVRAVRHGRRGAIYWYSWGFQKFGDRIIGNARRVVD